MSNKTPEMVASLDGISNALFGKSRSENISANVCVCCPNTELEFKDELSEKEFLTSGLCQECQDGVFG